MSETYDCSEPTSRAAGLEAAIKSVRAGAVVVAPADASYALIGDAFNTSSTAEIRNMKSSHPASPLSVFVGSWTTIDGLVSHVPTVARELIEAFWPGDLSLVLNHAPTLRWNIGDTRGTVTVRMPLHPIPLELLRATGPLVASVAPTIDYGEPRAITDIQSRLGIRVPVYLDSGRLPERTRSTVVDLTGDDVVVLRAGAISVDQLQDVVGRRVVDAEAGK